MKFFLLLILAGVMGCATLNDTRRSIGRFLYGPTAEEACGSKTGDALTICLTQWQADQNRRAADNAAFWANHNAQMNALQAIPADPNGSLIMRCGGGAVDFVTGRCL